MTSGRMRIRRAQSPTAKSPRTAVNIAVDGALLYLCVGLLDVIFVSESWNAARARITPTTKNALHGFVVRVIFMFKLCFHLDTSLKQLFTAAFHWFVSSHNKCIPLRPQVVHDPTRLRWDDLKALRGLWVCAFAWWGYGWAGFCKRRVTRTRRVKRQQWSHGRSLRYKTRVANFKRQQFTSICQLWYRSLADAPIKFRILYFAVSFFDSYMILGGGVLDGSFATMEMFWVNASSVLTILTLFCLVHNVRIEYWVARHKPWIMLTRVEVQFWYTCRLDACTDLPFAEAFFFLHVLDSYNIVWPNFQDILFRFLSVQNLALNASR